MIRRLTRIANRQVVNLDSLKNERVKIATIRQKTDELRKQAQSINLNIPEISQIQRAIDVMQRQSDDIRVALVNISRQQGELAKTIASTKGLTLEHVLQAVGWTSINADLRDVKSYLVAITKAISQGRK